MARTSLTSLQHAIPVHEAASPSVPDSIAVGNTQMPSDDVHLPLVNIPHVANLDDIFEVGIGEVDPTFDNSHELNTTNCRSSSYDDINDDDTDEHEFLNAPMTLDHMVWPTELLHNPKTLAKHR